MRKPIAVALLVAGALFLGMGFMASESFVSEVSEFFTGEPSDRTLVFIGASLVSLFAGAVLLIPYGKQAH